jgi:glycosyltransferase involved in cell wall biosynthesis
LNKPLLSIVIPTYNRADFLERCLSSVVASKDSRVEIVVSDNCSPDHTEKTARSFTDPRIRYFRQPENIGAVRNFRFLAGEAKGEYIFYLTDDDFVLTGGIEKVLDFITSSQPDGFKCGLLVYQINSHAAYLYSEFSRTFVSDPDDFESQSKIFWNAHIATCTCIRRDKLDYDLYDTNISNLYPSMMFMAMAREKLGYIHEPIAVHIWENEVFWDEGTNPEDSGKLLAHRGDILNIMEHRVPAGFLKACENKINRFSLNYAPIARFLSPEERKERQVAFKVHAFNVRYSRFVKAIFHPIDRIIRKQVANGLARLVLLFQ